MFFLILVFYATISYYVHFLRKNNNSVTMNDLKLNNKSLRKESKLRKVVFEFCVCLIHFRIYIR